MCGISGLLNYKGNWENSIHAMNAHMKDRGPDAEGVWKSPDAPAVFGHRRLAIIDLTKSGAQPFVTDIDLTLNGYEIVLPNEPLIPVDVNSLPDADAVYALDLTPYIPESDGIPRSMTLRGEYHHYLFKPDQFRGELILDSYEIHVSDRNGVLRGGQPTPEECREYYGENFVITINNCRRVICARCARDIPCFARSDIAA